MSFCGASAPVLDFVHTFLAGNLVLYLLVGAAFSLLTCYFLKKKLNLQ